MTTKNIECLIGRLRAFSGTSLAPALMHQAADTLQSQAERIKALELDLDVQAGSIRALRAALANAESIGWQKIETAPATANNVMAFSESGNMKIETGFWLINMLHAANIDGEKCNYTHWMPLPSRPGATL